MWYNSGKYNNQEQFWQGFFSSPHSLFSVLLLAPVVSGIVKMTDDSHRIYFIFKISKQNKKNYVLAKPFKGCQRKWLITSDILY